MLMRIQPGALELITCSTLNWKAIKFDMDPAWSSRAHYLIDSSLHIHTILHESNQKLHSSLLNSFWIEIWWSWSWSQPWALKVIIWLTHTCELMKFDTTPAWSSKVHYLLDSEFLNWEWIQLVWLQPGARRLIMWLLLSCQFIKFDMNPVWSCRVHNLIYSQS